MGYYDYYEVMEFLEDFGMAFLGAALGVLLVVGIVSIVMYVLQSAGLYAVAKRRRINNAWLAWIPVGSYWILGSIADHYQRTVNGKATNKRMIMLLLALAPLCLGLLSGLFNGIVAMTASSSHGAFAALSTINTIESLLNTAASIALLVFWHICLYNLYCSCNPNSSVLMLVLGIFFAITTPFFIFCNRNKDGGMRSRFANPQYGQYDQYGQSQYGQYGQSQYGNSQYGQSQQGSDSFDDFGSW